MCVFVFIRVCGSVCESVYKFVRVHVNYCNYYAFIKLSDREGYSISGAYSHEKNSFATESKKANEPIDSLWACVAKYAPIKNRAKSGKPVWY